MSESDAARQSVKGGLALILGSFVSAFVNLITVFSITRLLGPELYGLYTLSLVPPTIMLLITGVGVNTSITRFAAYHLARGEFEVAQRKTRNSIEFLLLIAIILSIVNYVGAPIIASSLLHRPDATEYVRLASILVLGQVMLTTAIASFVGWNTMAYASLSNVLQSVLKAAISILLIISGFGVFGDCFWTQCLLSNCRDVWNIIFLHSKA